jgi:hypothetical protein
MSFHESHVLDDPTYEFLYGRLRAGRDCERLAEALELPAELTRALYAQKMARLVRKNFHRLKARAHTLAREWKGGASFEELAVRHEFSPVMMASLILVHALRQASRPRFNGWLKEPASAPNPRLREELAAAVASDSVFSPTAHVHQAKNGRGFEDVVADWLRAKGAEFDTEEQNRANGTGKTPDFLLKKPLKMNGFTARWVECKATFGDLVETRRNLRAQLEPYARMFGEGVVLYHHGIQQTHAAAPGVHTATRKLLELA